MQSLFKFVELVKKCQMNSALLQCFMCKRKELGDVLGMVNTFIAALFFSKNRITLCLTLAQCLFFHFHLHNNKKRAVPKSEGTGLLCCADLLRV